MTLDEAYLEVLERAFLECLLGAPWRSQFGLNISRERAARVCTYARDSELWQVAARWDARILERIEQLFEELRKEVVAPKEMSVEEAVRTVLAEARPRELAIDICHAAAREVLPPPRGTDDKLYLACMSLCGLTSEEITDAISAIRDEQEETTTNEGLL